MSANNKYYAAALKKARKNDDDDAVRKQHVQDVIDYLIEVGTDGKFVETCEGENEFRLLIHSGDGWDGRGIAAKLWLEQNGVVP